MQVSEEQIEAALAVWRDSTSLSPREAMGQALEAAASVPPDSGVAVKAADVEAVERQFEIALERDGEPSITALVPAHDVRMAVSIKADPRLVGVGR